MNHVLLTNILCLGWINAQREREGDRTEQEQTPVSERAERDGTQCDSPDISQWAVGGDRWLLSSGPPLAQITQTSFPQPQPCLGRHSLYAVDVYKPPGQCVMCAPRDSGTWAIMTSHTNIRLLFSLGAALPFSQEPGLQPVFTWTTSLACGHFLGHLFRHLAGAGHQEDQAQDEGARADSQEQVVATPTPAPCQQRAHENTPRGRMVRNTRQRMQDKRQKHLRGSFKKLRDKNASEPAEPATYRGIVPVTEDRLLSEAARTLDNICSDYLCSLERKKVTD